MPVSGSPWARIGTATVSERSASRSRVRDRGRRRDLAGGGDKAVSRGGGRRGHGHGDERRGTTHGREREEPPEGRDDPHRAASAPETAYLSAPTAPRTRRRPVRRARRGDQGG